MLKKEFEKLADIAAEKARQFPQLKEEQVALVRTARWTGHSLTSKFESFIPNYKRYDKNNIELFRNQIENQEVYTVFESLYHAKTYIDSNKANYSHVEFLVYDKTQKFIYSSDY